MFIAISLAAAAALAAAAPTGPWYVNEEESLCTLSRFYPVGPRSLSLVFKPLLDLPTMELFVVKSHKYDRQYSGTFTVQIGTGGLTFTGRYFSVPLDKTGQRVTRLTIDRELLEQLHDGDVLHIKAPPIDQSFTIVRPEKARTALQGCVDGLKKSWGIDPAIQAQVASPLQGNPARYFNSGSYPREAFQAGVYGRVIALLNIDEAGAVTHCRILSSAGKSLNDGTCTVALRIRFKPARDKDGKALPSTYILPVHWVLGEQED